MSEFIGLKWFAGEVIEEKPDGWSCWIEIARGNRCHVFLSKTLLAHIDPCPGRAFLHYPHGDDLAASQFVKRDWPDENQGNLPG